MKKLIFLSLTASCFAYANPYAKCIACHGVNGEKTALNGKSKIIKNMSKAEIKFAMLGYKDGTYGGAMKNLMVMQSKPLSEAQIDAIAEMIGK